MSLAIDSATAAPTETVALLLLLDYSSAISPWTLGTEDLRIPFEKYGPLKDIYLPKNYYTGEPRGFGFVKFRYAEDAAEAKDRMNHKVIGGREIRIVFAEENRKTPQEMTSTGRTSSRHGGSSRRRSPPRSPRRRYRSSSRSVSPPRNDIS
ncbi:Serine/arginine-rich SC35-like splicing factor SCL28 [Linum perenne]